MFGYFTNETLVSGGMRGIEKKDDGFYSITDPSLPPAIDKLLLIKDHSFDTLIGGIRSRREITLHLLIDRLFTSR